MKKFLLYVWQLPQNILGLLIILFTRAKRTTGYWKSESLLWFGVSLGNYIIFGRPSMIEPRIMDYYHEVGHQMQSKRLGWFYLLIIGIPSFFGNVFDRIFHRNWTEHQRMIWYYSQPWEKWADELGNVDRFRV